MSKYSRAERAAVIADLDRAIGKPVAERAAMGDYERRAAALAQAQRTMALYEKWKRAGVLPPAALGLVRTTVKEHLAVASGTKPPERKREVSASYPVAFAVKR